jgi:NADPH-dependent curcumin reductase CurA
VVRARPAIDRPDDGEPVQEARLEGQVLADADAGHAGGDGPKRAAHLGGGVFDAVLPLLNHFARVPVCGLIAHYNQTEPPAAAGGVPALLMATLVKRLTFRGFRVSDFAPVLPQFLAEMSGWLKEGWVRYREDVNDGLENAPRELIGLLKGENFGKKLIRVGPDPTGR